MIKEVKAVPGKTLVHIPAEEQERMLGELRAARYGYILRLHLLLLCAKGFTPTEISRSIFCSRSSVYRIVASYLKARRRRHQRAGPEDDAQQQQPSLMRSLLCLVKRSPQSFGWGRTRWSCMTLAIQMKARRGVSLSRETVRKWLHRLGYRWKRARHVARDSDPERAEKLALIRTVFERLRPYEKLFFADEMDIHLLPKLGYEWMLKGIQNEVMTPGQDKKWYLAAAMDKMTGKILHVTAQKKTHLLFLSLLEKLERAFPSAKRIGRIYVVVDNYRIHKAKGVQRWLKGHPRIKLLWLPSYCPRANPIERVIGDVHDNCTRNHKRKELQALVSDVERHLRLNGPWQYALSEIYYKEEVEKAMQTLDNSPALLAA
jgi:transposase